MFLFRGGCEGQVGLDIFVQIKAGWFKIIRKGQIIILSIFQFFGWVGFQHWPEREAVAHLLKEMAALISLEDLIWDTSSVETNMEEVLSTGILRKQKITFTFLQQLQYRIFWMIFHDCNAAPKNGDAFAWARSSES